MGTRRKSSILPQVMSPTSVFRYPSPEGSEIGSEISGLSFKHWHRRMQTQHEILELSGRLGFGLWKWCYVACKPCRWFDSVGYDVKICKCCLKFRTFKSLGTLILIAIFTYIFMFSFLKNELLPGGTIFFLFILCVAAYVFGYGLMFIGLPSMFGSLLVGITFGNLPKSWLPRYDDATLEKVAGIFERILLILALIRAGLLLDMSRIKGHVQFIIRMSFLPLMSEFLVTLFSSHLLLKLPWEWSAVQGSVLSVVSLASVTSVMEKNRESGYGEDKNLSTVLIAASASAVILGIFSYVISLFFVSPSMNKRWAFYVLLNVVEQVLLGVTLGSVCGLLAAFFPDKRNSEAATLRIVVIGIGVFAIASILNEFDMTGAAVLSALIMSLVASNMWEELGWHDTNNPVQYFYSMAYYFGQPVALALVGFSMDFKDSKGENIGLSFAVIIIGVIAREITCFVTTMGKLYPTTIKEKIFICIAWFSKGTFQALLAFAIEFMIESNGKSQPKDVQQYTKCIQQTTVLAILLTTPLACFGLTLLTPVLLTKKDDSRDPERPEPME